MEIVENHRLPIKRLNPPGGGSTAVALWLAGPADSGEVMEPLWNCLSNGEKDRANRFLQAQDKRLFALTRAILRVLLSKATSVPAERIVFTEGPYGKPCLAGLGGRISMSPIRVLGP